MRWCLLGILLRWATCKRVWSLIICRILPKSGCGKWDWARHGVAICAYTWKREREWWTAGPRRKQFIELANGQRKGGDDGS